MKIAISYFYQVRNFKINMIPFSTALGDPKWYHDNQNKDYTFFDKRKILNGLRLNSIISAAKQLPRDLCRGKDSCNSNPKDCYFLHMYRAALEKYIDFDSMIEDLKKFAHSYQTIFNIKDEIIIVLLVHEAPTNPCSERQVLIDYFKSHGYDCEELHYPIK